jgi:SAM-dependent methyltransferase
VIQLDYVPEALARARRRVASVRNAPVTASVVCDLGSRESTLSIPIADGALDAALASLFISYVEDPRAVLAEIKRTLKPGGRLVVSGLRRDADVSKLFVEAHKEIELGGGIKAVESGETVDLQKASRDFLNDATRLLDLEELGLFEFRDLREMKDLLEASGFVVTREWSAYGDPPQAVVVSAIKA